MKGAWIMAGIFIVLFAVGASAWSDIHTWLLQEHLGAASSPTGGYGRAAVQFSDVTVEASIPLTSALEQKGLGGRTGLGSNEGMLFQYSQPSRYAFWMKGMVIPLDFIWMVNGQVADITANVPPPVLGQTDLPIYQPNQPVTAILEVNAGFTAAHGIAIGQAVRIDRR